MSARAVLDVQLVGHTVFTPPTKVEDRKRWLFDPDVENELGYAKFDGQALAEFAGRACYQSFDKPNPRTATNAGYLRHIFEVGHHSILEHGSVTFYITGISRSLTHEFIRHRHLSPSQLSQRYVDAKTMKMVIPPLVEKMIERTVDEAVARMAGDEVLTHPETGEPGTRKDVLGYCLEQYALEQKNAALENYDELVGEFAEAFPDLKVKEVREAGRSALPNATETRVVMSGNYRAWMHFLEMRDSIHADAEIARLAKEIGRQLAEHAPNIFGADARAIWDKQD